jgi:hypothetical protein
MILLKSSTMRLQKQNGHRLRQIYLNLQLKKRQKPKMRYLSPMKGLQEREEPIQIRLQKFPQ